MEEKKISGIPANSLTSKPIRAIALIIAIITFIHIIFKFNNIGLTNFIIADILLVIISLSLFFILKLMKGKLPLELSAHILLILFVLSNGAAINQMPNVLGTTGIIVGLILLISGLTFRWNFINQVIAVGYSLILIGVFSYINLGKITSISGLLEPITLLVVFGLGSVIASFKLNNNKKNQILPEKSTELKLNSTGDIYKGILDSLSDGIYKVSMDGEIIYINESLAKMFGCENSSEFCESEIAKNIFYDSEERQKLTKILRVQKRVKNYKIQFVKKDGSEILTKVSERIVPDEQDNPAFIEGIMRDVTQQTKVEEDRKREIAELKTEKTKAVKDVNSAVYTSNIKAQFLASMSHEIKTPINSIIGFLTLIEKGMFDSENELKEFALNAKTAADALLEIINNMLDISKIEAGKMELDDVEFDIRNEIEKAKSIISPVIAEKKLNFNVIVDNEIPILVYGDPLRFRQVTLNILSNSVKFTERGEIRIKLDLINTSDTTIKIKTTIIDTGRGIPEQKIPLLFKPYTQIKEKQWTQKDGTGLGLMISKEFVNLMGGEIDITSEEGIGTTVEFTVVLKTKRESVKEKKTAPVISEEKAKPVEEPPAVEPKITLTFGQKIKPPEPEKVTDKQEDKTPDAEDTVNTVSSKKKKRLLLVEDNPISQKVEKKLLSDSGYDVETVSSALDAIEAVKTNTFDLVLMDVEMPDMDGLTATQKIRSLDPPVSKIPIIAVTAHSSMKDREKCLASGMDDYIAKPININFMKMTIDQWLYRNIT